MADAESRRDGLFVEPVGSLFIVAIRCVDGTPCQGDDGQMSGRGVLFDHGVHVVKVLDRVRPENFVDGPGSEDTPLSKKHDLFANAGGEVKVVS